MENFYLSFTSLANLIKDHLELIGEVRIWRSGGAWICLIESVELRGSLVAIPKESSHSLFARTVSEHLHAAVWGSVRDFSWSVRNAPPHELRPVKKL